MEFNKQVENPMLIGAMEVYKADPTVEHKTMMIGEIIKGQYLCPVTFDPEPAQDENGKWILTNDNKVSFPMLTDHAGRNYIMAFTDQSELEKWPKGDKRFTFTCDYDDLFALIMRQDKEGNFGPMWGFSINPFTSNIVMDRDKMINLFIRKHPPKRPKV